MAMPEESLSLSSLDAFSADMDDDMDYEDEEMFNEHAHALRYELELEVADEEAIKAVKQ